MTGIKVTDTEKAEGQVVRHPQTGRYHVRIVRMADGKWNVSREGFATAAEAEQALLAWIFERGGVLEQ